MLSSSRMFVTVVAPVPFRLEKVVVVKVPATAELAPIMAPSIEPPSISTVVKLPEAAELAPMVAPSIVPPSMSTVVKLPAAGVAPPIVVPSIVPPSILTVEKVPAAAEFAPMVVPSIAPPLMSTVVAVTLVTVRSAKTSVTVAALLPPPSNLRTTSAPLGISKSRAELYLFSYTHLTLPTNREV